MRVACACACALRGPSYLAGIDVGYTAPCCRLALRAATATAWRGRHASSCSGAARRVGGGDSDSGRATPCRAVPVPVRADLDRCWWWWSACLRSRTGRGAGALQQAQDHDHGGPFWPLEAHGATDDSSESETGSSVG